MKLTVIERDEFHQFATGHPKGSFLQSGPIGLPVPGSPWRSHYLGLRAETGQLVAAALLRERSVMGRGEFECIQGPVVDYVNQTVVKTLLAQLATYVRRHGGMALTIQPPLVLRRGEDPRTLRDDPAGRAGVAAVEAAGFRPVPTAVTDTNLHYLRWVYVKDLSAYSSADELLAGLPAKVRNCIKTAHGYGVTVREVTERDQLQPFVGLMLATGRRRGFEAREYAYYDNFFTRFSRQQARFLLAEVRPAEYQQRLARRVGALEKELAGLVGDPEAVGRRRDLAQQLAALQARQAKAAEWAAQAGATPVPLAAAIFVKIGPEVLYYLSGSDDRFRGLHAPYLLQEAAMRWAVEQGIDRYNFFGTNGSFNNRPDEEGVYKFKKDFRGVHEERAGCYRRVVRPLHWGLVQLLRRLKPARP